MKQHFEDIKPIRTKKTRSSPPAVSTPTPEAAVKPLFKKINHTAPLTEDLDVVTDSYSAQKPPSGWGGVISRVLGVIIVLGAILYGLSFAFRGATVTVTPKTVHGTINQTVKATKDQNTGATGGLSYQIMTLSDSVTKQVVATKTDVVSTKASGTVILYNNQATPQKLVAQTRFADSKGAVFRLKNPVTIPAKFTKAGTVVPGSVEAVLVADAPGTQGNIGLSDFSVVAFTGTAQAKLVYARSKSAFIGGESGSVYYLDDNEYNTYAGPMLADLTAKLNDESVKQIPEGYVLLSDTLQFIPDTDKNKNNTAPSEKADLTLVISGKISGILIKQVDLANAFIASTVADQKVSLKDVTVHGIPQLTYHTTTPLDQTAFPSTISFQVSGTVDIVWNVDQSAVQNVLVGVSRKDFSSRMQAFGSVDAAELVIKPFWVYVIPKDPAKIEIKIKNTAAN